MKLFSLLVILLPINAFSMNEPEGSENIDACINMLAPEIIEMILSNAAIKDIYSFCLCSKTNFKIFNDDYFWKLLSKRDFPEERAMLVQEPKDGWKEFYKSCLKKSVEPVAPKVHERFYSYFPLSFSLGYSYENPSFNGALLKESDPLIELGFAW